MNIEKNKVIGLNNIPTIWDCINKDFVSEDKLTEFMGEIGEISSDYIEIFFKNHSQEIVGGLSTFKIGNDFYYFIPDATWEEWVNSSYNNGVFEIIDNNIKHTSDGSYISDGSELVQKNSKINIQIYYLTERDTPIIPEQPKPTYQFIIIPTPADSNVTLTCDGYDIVEGTGETSIEVDSGAVVNWTVSCDGYNTKTGNETVNSASTIYVNLEKASGETTTQYTLTIITDSSNTVALTVNGKTHYTNTIQVENGTEVQYSVTREGYKTVVGVVVVDNNRTINIELDPDESQYKKITIKLQENFWGTKISELEEDELKEVYSNSGLCNDWDDFISLFPNLIKDRNRIMYGNHHQLYAPNSITKWTTVDTNMVDPESGTYALLYITQNFTINGVSYVAYKDCNWRNFAENNDGFHISGDRIIDNNGYYISLNDKAVAPNETIIGSGKYKLNSPVQITNYTFYIDDIEYETEAGKTFKDWAESTNNNGEFYCLDNYKYIFKHTAENPLEDKYVKSLINIEKSDEIQNNQRYYTENNNCVLFKIDDDYYNMFFEDDRLSLSGNKLSHDITWSDFFDKYSGFAKDGEYLVKYDKGSYYITLNGEKVKIDNFIEHDGVYSLVLGESSQTISFTINNKGYEATPNMTWENWVNSTHNSDKFKIDDLGFIVNSAGKNYIKDVLCGNTIEEGGEYTSISYSQGKFHLSCNNESKYEYCFVYGMTWENWVNQSNYGWSINENKEIISSDGNYKINGITPSDTIDGITYELSWMNNFKIRSHTSDTEYMFESGMNWGDWVNSTYNSDGFKILDNTTRVVKEVVKDDGSCILDIYGVDADDEININNVYKLVVKFTIDDIPNYALYGMTWKDWANNPSYSSNYTTFDGDDGVDDGVYFIAGNYKKLKLGEEYINKTHLVYTNGNLTKEEVTSFSIDVNGELRPYVFKPGMTWGQWVKSEYNNTGNIFNNRDTTTDTATYYKDADGNLYRIGFGDINFNINPITYKVDSINGLGTFYIDGQPYNCIFTEFGGGSWERWVDSMYNENNEITFKKANLEISIYTTDYVYHRIAEKFIYDEDGTPQSADSVIKSNHHYKTTSPTDDDNTTGVKYSVVIEPTPTEAVVDVTYYEDGAINKSSSQGAVSMNADSGTAVYYTIECEGYVSTSGCKNVLADENISVTLKESQQSSTSRSSTLTIIPSPADSNVTLTCDGYDIVEGTGETSIEVDRMNWISYTVSCDGYDTKTGKCLLYLDKAEIITLNETAKKPPVINTPKLHSFLIDGVEINYLVGQTWREWVGSAYNTHNAKIEYLSGVECVTFPSDSNYYCKILMYDGWGYTLTQPDNSMHSGNRFQEIGMFVLDKETHHFQLGHTWKEYLNSEFNNTKFDHTWGVNGAVYPTSGGRTIIKTTANFEEWELADNIIEHEGEYKNACIYDKSKKYSFDSTLYFPECKYYQYMDWESWLQSDLNMVKYYYDEDLKIITNGADKLVGNSNYNITKPEQRVTGDEDLYSYIFFYLDDEKIMATAAYGKNVVYWSNWVNGNNTYFFGDDGSIFSKDGQRYIIDVNNANERIIPNGRYYTKSINDMGKPYVYHSQDSTSNNYLFRIQPNTMHIWDEVENLNITFAPPEIYDGYTADSMSSEYIIQFKCPTNKTAKITLPKYTIVGHNGFKPGKIYKCSLMDNILSILEYDDDGNYQHTSQTLNHKSLAFDYNVVNGEYVGCGPVGIKYSSYPIRLEHGGDSVNRVPKTNIMRVWRNTGNVNIKFGEYNPKIRSQETFAVVVNNYSNVSVTLPSNIKWVNGGSGSIKYASDDRITPIYQISCFGGLATILAQHTHSVDACNHATHNCEHSASGYGVVTMDNEKLHKNLKDVGNNIKGLEIYPYRHYMVNIDSWVNGESLGLELINVDEYTMNEYIIQLEIGNVENIPLSLPKHVKLTNSISYNKDILLERNSIYQIFITNNLATIIRVRK